MATHLKAGDKAPLFTATDEQGNQVSLSDFKGKKLAFYFYPQDDTPVCTVQACNLRDNYESLLAKGVQVIGISPDDAASHKKFRQKFNLPFPLLPDPDHTIIDQYGVWGEKNMYGRKFMGLLRTTFIIDEKGMIERIILKPNSKVHTEQILK
jgi:peroxiredoxin Q/BCP